MIDLVFSEGNVLLLRNEIKLDPDTPEVPLSMLKQLVEEKLLDLVSSPFSKWEKEKSRI
jgi:hypothetical protein